MTVMQSILNEFPNRELVDATSSLTIHVTKPDVEKATPKEPRSCALAWAVYRENKAEEVIVYKSVAYVVYPKRIVRYTLSSLARNGVIAYDLTGIFAPGEYYFYPPPDSQRLEAMRTRGTARGPHKGHFHQPRRFRPTPGVRTFG